MSEQEHPTGLSMLTWVPFVALLLDIYILY